MSIWDSRALLIYCCCVAAVLGAVFGSFLNCAAWRIAHGSLQGFHADTAWHAALLRAGEDPQHDQHQVVRGIGDGEPRAAAEREIRRDKAGGDGNGTGNEVGGMKAL